MKKLKQSVSILIVACLFYSSTTNAQVSIGDQLAPDADAILDLTNFDNLGLLLPHSASNPNSGSLSAAPEGLLVYYKENFFLKGSGSLFNSITPWKSIYTGAAPSNVYFNPTGYTGVGIGLDGTDIKANLHVALTSKEVNTSNTSASFIIGGSDADTHMSMDNDEILVKNSANNTTGTLKLQEGGGTVQVGESATVRSTLNVYGEVQQHSAALVPVGGISMWTGSTIPAGWALCNGSPYTKLAGGTIVSPDLRDRFIVGTGGSYTAGQTGGENSIALSRSEIPSHQHEASSNGASIAISSSGAHEHEYDYIPKNGKGYVLLYNSSNEVLGYGNWTQDDTEGGGNHTHPNSNFTGSTGSGSGLSGSSVGSAHENRPPYYAVAYIMKL